MSNKQVAMLVPTTVLAQQHLQTFSERFAEFPVRIEMLSRFRTRKELLQTCDEIGLSLTQELWFTRLHKVLRAGGICVELQKR